MAADVLGGMIGGVVPPIATPLTERGEVDDASLRHLADWLVREGVAGVFALGSTGETVYLTDADRLRAASVVARTVRDRVPLLLGVVEPTARRAVDAARALVELGPAALVVTGPFYARADEAETMRHFEYVASRVPVPLLAYNIPANIGYGLAPETMARLVDLGVVHGVKDSSPDVENFATLVGQPARPGVPYFTGSDVALDGALRAGANGAVAGLSNVAPGLFRQALEAHSAQNRERLDALQATIRGLADVYTPSPGSGGLNSTQLGSIKTALKLLGLIESDQVSPPMGRTPPDRVELIRAILRRAGLL